MIYRKEVNIFLILRLLNKNHYLIFNSPLPSKNPENLLENFPEKQYFLFQIMDCLL